MNKRELGHKIIGVCDESGLGAMMDIVGVLYALISDLESILIEQAIKQTIPKGEQHES